MKEPNSEEFFKVPACCEPKALPSPCSHPCWRPLHIWADGKEWNVSMPDPSQGSPMAPLLFPESTGAPVELGKDEYQGQFS